MQTTTLEIVRSALKADPSLAPAERQDILAALRNRDREPGQPADRLLRPAEVARILGRSVRSVHMLARDGVLRKVSFPGRARAAGFRQSDVLALLSGAES